MSLILEFAGGSKAVLLRAPMSWYSVEKSLFEKLFAPTLSPE